MGTDEEKVREITVAACFEQWLEEKETQLRPATFQLYRQQIDKHILPKLGCMEMRRLSQAELDHFFYEKRESGRLDGGGGLSSSVLNLMKYLLNALQQYARENGYREDCVCRSRLAGKAEAKEKDLRILTRLEQLRLEGYLSSRFKDVKYGKLYLGIYTALYTGLRVGELGGMQWGDVDFERKELWIRRSLQRMRGKETEGSKTSLCLEPLSGESAERRIPMSQELSELLLRYARGDGAGMQGMETAPVFTYRDKPIEPRMFQQHLKQVLEETGIEQVNFQVMRHTYAARSLEAGMSLWRVSELLGLTHTATVLRISEKLYENGKESQNERESVNAG